MKNGLLRCDLDVIRDLCEKYHGYGGAGSVGVYAFGVFEDDKPVAGYSWQPPPPGAAKSVCSEAPSGVLALSRMVAVPKPERRLKHVSKPLRTQMKHLIDRTRWPVLVTYSDESQGHTGYVYACSGWEKTSRTRVPIFENDTGQRVSRYSNGVYGGRDLKKVGYAWIQRWEHWVCPRGEGLTHMLNHGWERRLTGGTYRSGNPGYRWERN